MENLPQFNLPLDTIVSISFYLVLMVYAVFTSIFYYHWQNYSTNRSATITTYLAYFGITLPLLALMGLSLLVI